MEKKGNLSVVLRRFPAHFFDQCYSELLPDWCQLLNVTGIQQVQILTENIWKLLKQFEDIF